MQPTTIELMSLQISLIFFGTLVTNFLTLVPLALKSPNGIKTLYQNPAFVLGDFLAIPTFAAFSVHFLAQNSSIWLNFLTPTFALIAITTFSLFIFLIFYLFKPHKHIGILPFIPHILFSILIVCLLILVTTTLIETGTLPTFAILTYIAVSFHLTIGWIFPKRFDSEPGLFQIKNNL